VLLGLIAVIATPFVFFVAYSEVMEKTEIFSFEAKATPPANPQVIQISGTLKSSVLVVSKIQRTVRDRCMSVTVNATFARNPLRHGSSSTFHERIEVPPDVDRIVFGQRRAVVWQR
jgi:hypothetical protein